MKKHLFQPLPALGLALCLACSDGIEPVPFQGISGQVTFLGEVPDSTEWVRLVIYRTLPRDSLQLLSFVAFSDTFPLDQPSTPYFMELQAGEYAWLPLVWKKKDAPLAPEALRVMGWYSAGGAPFDSVRLVTVETESETAEINLIGDFRTMLTPAEALEAIR
ncbi:MAG TPA: hypothetical protein VLC48_03920 [Gemmatimonadota bacterium]|nr:hypothetical protein [Gemmatimonadota bacterium]